MAPLLRLHPFYRADLLPELRGIVKKVSDPSGGRIILITGVPKVKSRNRFAHHLIYAVVFLLIVKRTVLKDKIL